MTYVLTYDDVWSDIRMYIPTLPAPIESRHHFGTETKNTVLITTIMDACEHTVPTYAGLLTVNDLRTVHKAVWDACTKWMDIGLELDLRVADLTAIDEAHHGDVGRCFNEMLSLWLRKVDPPLTWSAMVAALQDPDIGYGDLAEQVESMNIHQSSEASDSTGSDSATGSQGEIVPQHAVKLVEIVIYNHSKAELGWYIVTIK